MKKKIAILGSTGSIGKSTLDVIRKDKKFFEIVFLSANNNYKKLIEQAKEFNVKNVLINNKTFYERTKRSLKNSKTKVYSGDFSITNIIYHSLFLHRYFSIRFFRNIWSHKRFNNRRIIATRTIN